MYKFMLKIVNLLYSSMLFSDILSDFMKNKPTDYQLPLFINLHGQEYPVTKTYLNYLKIFRPGSVEFYKIEDIMFSNV